MDGTKMEENKSTFDDEKYGMILYLFFASLSCYRRMFITANEITNEARMLFLPQIKNHEKRTP